MNIPFVLIGLAFLLQPAVPAAPKLAVSLHANRTAIAAGESVELAIEIGIPEPWHIYHPIILDTGFATTIEFEGPAGLRIGPPRFPEPTLEETVELEYLEFSGKIVALATLHADADLPAGAIATLTVNVSALACIEQCIPVEASAKLDLAIAAGGKPANEKLFTDAAAAIPTELTKAEYLQGSAIAVKPTTVGLNERGELIATIRVKDKHHVQDRDPGVDSLIPTRLLVEPIDGIEFAEESEQVWSKPHVREMAGFGKVREQSGEFTIRVPFKVTDPKMTSGPIPVRLLLQYQCCSDAGQCYAPAWARAVATIDFARDKAVDPAAVANADSGGDESQAAGLSEPPEVVSATTPPHTLWYLLGLAFLGGIILNIMPCVLPVISLKILGFAQQAGDDRGRVFRMGLVYALGIGASFLPIAITMAVAGAAWGSLMQSPYFIIALAVVVFAFGLSLVGVFEFQLPGFAMNAADGAIQREGFAGAFFNGVMTTALATPCTAPLLGSAIGLLTQFPPLAQFAGIMTVGAGLAAPYVLLSAFPAWLRFMPKPGAWMVTFKEVVGFVMFAVVVWLLSILRAEVEPETLLGTLGLLVVIGFACWLVGTIKLNASPRRVATTWVAVVLTLVGGGYGSFRAFDSGWQQIPWQAWSPGLPKQLAGEGYTVYVDYTADWCLTCQANKRLVLETDPVREMFKQLDILPVKGDFTKRDPRLLDELRQHDRNGVPLNIIIPAGRTADVIVLPEVLTQSLVLDALKRAGASERKPALVKK